MPDSALGGDWSSIPMGFKPTQFGGAQSDPFETISKFAGIQNSLNQNKLFQQTFAARKRMGQIFATSSDPEDALGKIMQDPLAAPFAGEVIGQYRGAMLSLQQLQNEQQSGAVSGMDAVMKGMSAGISDPATLKASIDAKLKTLSPVARERVAPAVNSLVSSLVDGLPNDPLEARKVFQQRLAGVLLGSGTTPESIRAITGRPAPTISMAPTGPGGAEEPIQLGGSAAGSEPLVSRPQDNALGAAAPAGVQAPVLGPTETQKTEFKKIGETGGDVSDEITKTAMGAPLQGRRLDKLIEAMGQFQSGGLADLRGAGAKVLQGLKNAGVAISQKTIDEVSNGSLKSQQEFVALLKSLVIKQLSQDAQGQGQIRTPEVTATLNALNETNDPAAVVGVLNQVRAGIQLAYDRGKKFLQFKRDVKKPGSDVYGLDLADFPTWYLDQINWDKMPTATQSGFNMALAKSSQVKGGGGDADYQTPEEVVKAYNDGDLTKSQAKDILKSKFGRDAKYNSGAK